MVKVDVPSAIAAGISRSGIAAARNSACAIGARTKNGDEEADAAIGDERTSEHDRQHGPSRTQALGHEVGDGCDRAAVLHQLAEQGAEEKNREELHDELRGAAHEGLRPVGEQRLPGESGGEDGGGRSEQKHAPAPIREPDQQSERDKNAEQSHCVRPAAAKRRYRGWSGARDPKHASPKRLARTFVLLRAAWRRIPIPR